MSAKTLSLPQVIGLMAVVVLLVFGVTYASLFLAPFSQPVAAKTGKEPVALKPQLVFGDPADMSDENRQEEPHERRQPGWKTFWFRNPGDQPVTIKLDRKNCRCHNVEASLLPAEWASVAVKDLDARATDPALDWQIVEGDKTLEVPPGARGGVRLHWIKDKANDKENFNAVINTRSGDVDGAPISLQASVTFIEPVMVNLESNLAQPLANNEATKIDLEPGGGEQKVNFVIWSRTREELHIDPKTEVYNPHPCVTWSEPRKLSDEERKKLAERDEQKVLCAYGLTATVRVKGPDGRQLDLGPYRSGLTLTFNDTGLDPVMVRVSGMVHGEVTVGGSEDYGMVNFLHVASGAPRTRIIYLNSLSPDLGLELDPDTKRPDYLEAKLEPEVKSGTQSKSWKLSVTLNTTKVRGALPRDESVIVLRTNGSPPRKLRVPVTGNVYVNK